MNLIIRNAAWVMINSIDMEWLEGSAVNQLIRAIDFVCLMHIPSEKAPVVWSRYAKSSSGPKSLLSCGAT